VHLTHTPIWCDAVRRRDVCFVSSADRIAKVGHGQLIGTPTTLAMVGLRQRDGFSGHLAVPVRRPFALGTLRLELIPSGRSLGTAALHVDARGRTVLYAGPVRTEIAARDWDAAEVRTCDAVVVAAPFGEPHHAFGRLDDVADRLVSWLRRELAADRAPVIVVDSALDALEVARRIDTEVAVTGSAKVRAAAKRLGALESVPAIRAPGKFPAALICVDGERGALPAKAVQALVSARAIDVGGSSDEAFAWPFVAGREQLLAWIEQTRARRVFVTGACAETIVRTLGDKARRLGPPHQMPLFPREE